MIFAACGQAASSQTQWWKALNKSPTPQAKQFIPEKIQVQQQQQQVNYNSIQNHQGNHVHQLVQPQQPIQNHYANVVPVQRPQPVIIEQPQPVQVIQNVAPFSIQQPVISHTGELIIENTLGGIDFDCRFLPTGHWRDTNFCDVYHACVHGYHRKTYTCPIVGERTYFDELTQRCEFVHLNPAGCNVNRFVF